MEGYPFYYNYAGEDVVVLAGDIHTQGRHNFILDQIPTNVKVLMVAGNHEYYGATFEDVNMVLYELQAQYPNFYYLQNESIWLNHVEFFGGTMYTDFELYGSGERWFAEQRAKNGIADFTWISRKTDEYDRRWTTTDHIREHQAFCKGLENWIADTKDSKYKKVVISHFVPHPDGSDPKYSGSPLQPYFISDMRRYMGAMDLWIYGLSLIHI